ncbi:diguanylate cyclase (GGDEF) domain-containing protein [Methylobacterium gossipiicola]|uniref:Diguanylate cyclase (GGDEF) domain-containing protein n=1 Tax=Methylobacterium gossipiicola TaxID=582675 RepID=A0A1I2WAI1_9HYPH|nr:diguanylate cyclase (GGDEF) domain-containing protein [Methylobacterium gossipiicola]
MRDQTWMYSPPRWRLIRWLTNAGPDVPTEIHIALIRSLFGTLPLLAGAVVNTLLVSACVAYRIPRPEFLIWCAVDVLICALRVGLLIAARRAAAQRRETPTDLYILLGLAWAASLGYGLFVSFLHQDWVVTGLIGMSSAAVVGGIAFRNFGAPRLVAVMIITAFAPGVLAVPFSGEPIMLIVLIQAPFYLVSMSIAGFRLNRMLVTTMRAERENAFRAQHDSLTGLLNRAGLMAAMGGQPGENKALFFLDLDGFKAVNDVHGHAAGDMLLQAVADRLRNRLGPGDLLARLGGDEFVVLTDEDSRSALLTFAERMREQVSVPYALGSDRTVRIGVSIGLALASEHGSDLANLLSAADAALYEAKAKGKDRCYVASALAA